MFESENIFKISVQEENLNNYSGIYTYTKNS